ncbi:MAG TPA: amino acid adenylation domain-containing protein [Symbiobacteriaceae bacterium]|nr:amino acid adenylation domain-containing protein [Symbiobacteriaceae bacterium]
MRPDQIEELYELSPMQQGLLFHTLQAPESEVYVVQVSYAFDGGFHPVAFRDAWEKVMERYAVFRTSFHWEEIDKPLQAVHRRLPLPWEEIDWRGMPAEEQQVRFEAYLEAERRRGFDPRRPPLMRFALIQTDETAYRFVWTHHHLLLDGWSMALVLKDLFTAYEALARGESYVLPYTRPYRSYIAWLSRQDIAQAEAFWRQQLRGFSAPTRLPVERLVKTDLGPSTGARKVEWQLTPELTATLQSLARQHQLTMNTLVQGAWAVLLNRYSGEEDLVYGSTVACRPVDLPDVETMVGLFINTLPVRVRVPHDASLIPWLQALQTTQVEQRQFEYTPLVQVQGWSDLPRGTSLFETIVVFENYPVDTMLTNGEGNVNISDIRSVEKSSYLLSLTVRPGTQLSLGAMYDGQRLDEETVHRLLGHLTQILQGMAANPAQPVGHLQIVTAAEESQLARWRGASSPYPRQASLAALFEQQAAQAPSKVALALGAQQMTYGELDQRANQLAHTLQRQGVSTDTPVGLCLERSFDQVVALLGILKAGGAYVPLDPAYPAERLSFMIQDTGVPVLITGRGLGTKLPPHTAVVVDLDQDRATLAQESTTPPPCPAAGDSLAYIMYTSGSTGQPKGIAIPQRAVVRLVKGTDFVDFGSDQVWLQYAPISFDASTLEIWGALLNGATLAICPPGQASLGDLGRTIAQHQVTSMWLTAGLFQEMVDGNLEGLQPVRQLLAGGDVLSAPHVERVLTKLPHCRLINGYGPTENTTFTCCHTITTVVPGRSIPIGKPITNTQVWILDAQQRQVPVGVPGELYAGGEGLARGYWKRPDLTDDRFVPNPFGSAGSRLYRTGDLTRWLPDGTVEFLGRRDFQVKIRGFRIELGEIESALVHHPLVREAVVVTQGGEGGATQRLVAYLVPADGDVASPGLEPAALSRFLQRHLPQHMIPSTFVTLAQLPLNPNGKVDRKALPAPEARVAAAEAVLPQSALEQAIAAVWQSVLEVENLGRHDNFFDLGGNSLLMVRAHTQLQQRVGREFPLVEMFHHPTLLSLAQYLGDAHDQASRQDSFQETADRAASRRARLENQWRTRKATR